MENTSKISKLFLYLTAIAYVIFIGSYLTKLAILNQFFDAESMALKGVYVGKDLTETFRSLLPLYSISSISFITFIFFFLVWLIKTKINVKKEGWLFIITIILLVTSPFEIYLILKYDWTIIEELLKSDFYSDYIIDLTKSRSTALGPFPLILLFSNFIVIFLALFKPLQKKS